MVHATQKTHLVQQPWLIQLNCAPGGPGAPGGKEKKAKKANILTHGSLSPQYQRLQGIHDFFKNNGIVKSFCLGLGINETTF